jgi:hypothetical protein
MEVGIGTGTAHSDWRYWVMMRAGRHDFFHLLMCCVLLCFSYACLLACLLALDSFEVYSVPLSCCMDGLVWPGLGG